MKLTSRNLPVLARVAFLAMIAGTLAWELVERLAGVFGVALALGVGPVGFDVRVVSVSVMANPGTLLALLPAVLVFRRL